MGLRINDTIPNLHLETDLGSFDLHDWIGDSWAILFSHPKDFTPVCTTEFGAVAQLADEWAARGTKVIGLSVDGAEEHVEWKRDIEKYSGAPAGFPIIADESLEVAKALDMLPADAYLPDSRTAADSASVRHVCGSQLRRGAPCAGCTASDLPNAHCHSGQLGAGTGCYCRFVLGRRGGEREVW